MKIAISTEKDNIDSTIDQRFGRCKYFLIVDIQDDKVTEIRSVDNKGAIQGHGAGIRAASTAVLWWNSKTPFEGSSVFTRRCAVSRSVFFSIMSSSL